MSKDNYDLKSLVLRYVSAEYLMKSEKCFIPLFHGTDSNIVCLTDEIRVQRKNAAMILIDYAYPILKAKNVGKMRLNEPNSVFREHHQTILDTYSCAGNIKLESKSFEYENCYVTVDPDKAYRYAKRAHIYGELGYIAYNLCIALKMLNHDIFDMDDYQREALKIIVEANNCDPDPIVYMYLGVPKEKIQKENGDEINWIKTIYDFLEGYYYGTYRILKPFDITSGTVVDMDSLPRISS